jgi:hypothetical protein
MERPQTISLVLAEVRCAVVTHRVTTRKQARNSLRLFMFEWLPADRAFEDGVRLVFLRRDGSNSRCRYGSVDRDGFLHGQHIPILLVFCVLI